MRRLLFSISLLTLIFGFSASPLAAQCSDGWALIQASKIMRLDGQLLTSGNFAISGVDASRKMINFTASGGGTVMTVTAKSPVSNGAITNTVCVPRSDRASVYVRYHFVVTDNSASGSRATVVEAWDVPITSDIFSLDSYTYPANAYANPPNEFTSGHVTGDLTVTGTITGGNIVGATAVNANHANTADTATSATSATNAGHATTADAAGTATTAANADHATTADSAATAGALSSSPGGCSGGQAATGINADGTPISCVSPGTATAAGSVEDVQFRGSASFDADSGYFGYDKVKHALKSNVNGVLNSDNYAGVAGAFSGAQCVGQTCLVYRGPNSAYVVTLPFPASGMGYVSESGLTRLSTYHNPMRNAFNWPNNRNDCQNNFGSCLGTYYDTDNPFATTTPQTGTLLGQHIYQEMSMPGWNFGNSPNVPSVGAWLIGKTLALRGYSGAGGIYQGLGIDVTHYADGDTGGIYVQSAHCDGGQPDYSGEGCVGINAHTGETDSYFAGKVSTTSSASTSLAVAYDSSVSIVGRAILSHGSAMLNLSTPVMTGQSVAGATANTSYVNVYSVPITGGATPSTAYGAVCSTCELTTTAGNPNIPITESVTVPAPLGSTSLFVPGIAWISGDFPEQVTINSVTGSAGSSQTISLTHHKPHGAANTALWQGGTNGYISFDWYSSSGRIIPYHVFGATDATHIVIDGPSPWQTPVALTAISRSGTTVTATPAVNSGVSYYNSASAVSITGCSDSSVNGNAANATYNGTTNVLTFTSASSGTTTCASASMSRTSSDYAFTVYPGAEVLSAGGVSAASATTVTLEPNGVTWTAGQSVVQPHHPIWRGENQWLIAQHYNPTANATGLMQIDIGAGVNGNYNAYSWGNKNPCSMYQGCGGKVTLPTLFNTAVYGTKSPYGVGFNLGSTPLAGLPFISFGCPLTSYGCSDPSPMAFVSFQQTGASSLYMVPNYGWAASNFVSRGSGTWALPTGTFSGGAFNSYGTQFASTGVGLYQQSGVLRARLGLCNGQYVSGAIATIGATCIATDGNYPKNFYTDGMLIEANIISQQTATLGGLNVTTPDVLYKGSAVFTGTAGSTLYTYYVTVVSPLGIESPVPTTSPLSTLTVSTGSATLDASNYITITLPSTAQLSLPSGSTFRVRRRVGVSTSYVIGTGAAGSSFVDDGSVTTATNNPGIDGNLPATAGEYRVNAGGGVAYYSENSAAGVTDTWTTRGAQGTLRVGKTKGTNDGTLDTANGVFGSTLKRGGVDVCTSDGTNCPSSGSGSGSHQLTAYYPTSGAALPTGVMVGPVFYEAKSGTLTHLQARMDGVTGGCSTAPVVVLMDLGTSASTSYGSATALVSLTIATDGVFSTTVSVSIVATHYYGYAFSAGSCSDNVYAQLSATVE